MAGTVDQKRCSATKRCVAPDRWAWMVLFVVFGLVFALLLCPTTTLASTSPSGSASVTVLADPHATYRPLAQADVYVDSTMRLTFDQVSSPSFASRFAPYSRLGSTSGDYALWLRLRLVSPLEPAVPWLLVYNNPRINRLDVFVPQGEGYRTVTTGNEFAFSGREFAQRVYVIRLGNIDATTDTVYVRLYDTSGFVSPTSMSIQTLDSFAQWSEYDYFWAGAYYFVILTVLFFSLVFYFSLRERALLAFSFFLGSVFLLSLSSDGLGQQLFWPNWPWWALESLLISALIYVAALLTFTSTVLDIQRYLPRWALALKVLVGLIALVIVARLLASGPVLAALSIPLAILLFAALVLPLILAALMIRRRRAAALLFLAGFSAYLCLNLLALIETLQSGTQNIDQWTRTSFIWLLVMFALVIQQRVREIYRDREHARAALLAEQTEALRVQADLAQALERSRDGVIEAYDTTLEGWTRLLESRDKETEGHSRQVTELTVRFAEKLGLAGDALIDIRRGALLHDIGKIAVPDAILLKPGPLTEPEWEIMRQHPLFAQKALSGIPFLERALDVPVYHHERWDGRGYPFGLKGDDIPLAARIFTIVDNWDALASDRPYRKAWPPEKIAEHLSANAGVIFDPEIVPVFLDLVEQKGHELGR